MSVATIGLYLQKVPTRRCSSCLARKQSAETSCSAGSWLQAGHGHLTKLIEVDVQGRLVCSDPLKRPTTSLRAGHACISQSLARA